MTTNPYIAAINVHLSIPLTTTASQDAEDVFWDYGSHESALYALDNNTPPDTLYPSLFVGHSSISIAGWRPEWVAAALEAAVVSGHDTEFVARYVIKRLKQNLNYMVYSAGPHFTVTRKNTLKSVRAVYDDSFIALIADKVYQYAYGPADNYVNVPSLGTPDLLSKITTYLEEH